MEIKIKRSLLEVWHKNRWSSRFSLYLIECGNFINKLGSVFSNNFTPSPPKKNARRYCFNFLKAPTANSGSEKLAATASEVELVEFNSISLSELVLTHTASFFFGREAKKTFNRTFTLEPDYDVFCFWGFIELALTLSLSWDIRKHFHKLLSGWYFVLNFLLPRFVFQLRITEIYRDYPNIASEIPYY